IEVLRRDRGNNSSISTQHLDLDPTPRSRREGTREGRTVGARRGVLVARPRVTRVSGAVETPRDPAVRDRGAGAVVTVVLAALSMLGPFTIDTVFPAFARMGDELGADATAMQQVTSVYMLAFAVMSVFHGPI